MKIPFLLLCLACGAMAAPSAKKQPDAAKPLPPLEKATISIDGHPESVAADDQGNIYFTSIGAKLTPKRTRTAIWVSFPTVPRSLKRSRTWTP